VNGVGQATKDAGRPRTAVVGQGAGVDPNPQGGQTSQFAARHIGAAPYFILEIRGGQGGQQAIADYGDGFADHGFRAQVK
jgi:hypothetical protein